jgi:hypothetical protein
MNATPARSQVPAEFRDHGGATDKQLSFITKLLEEKEMDPARREKFDARVAVLMDRGEFDTRKASEVIDFLMGLPRKQYASSQPREERPQVAYSETETDAGTKRIGRLVLADGREVHAGSYGIPTPGDDFTNATTFFKLWIGDRGGWNIKMYVSDDTYKIGFPLQLSVLSQIADGPEAAASLFGHEYGRCGICGRGLTNDESRARGIGPVCARRFS